MVEAHIVENFSIGNTNVRIADDFCKQSRDEVLHILRQITIKAQRALSAAASAGNHEDSAETINS